MSKHINIQNHYTLYLRLLGMIRAIRSKHNVSNEQLDYALELERYAKDHLRASQITGDQFIQVR